MFQCLLMHQLVVMMNNQPESCLGIVVLVGVPEPAHFAFVLFDVVAPKTRQRS
jgi:hypothetical protein